MSAPHQLPGVPDLPLWERNLPVLLDGSAPRDAACGAELLPLTGRTSEVRERTLQARQVAQAQEAAERLLARAEEEAARIVAGAQEQVEQARARARQEAAEAVAREQETAFREIVTLLRAEVTAQFETHWKELELEAARLCVELAERIIRTKIAEDDSVVVRAVQEGLGRMMGARSVTIRVHPRSESALRSAVERLAAELPSGVTLEVNADPSVGTGGALLQSTSGEIDLRLESQLERLRAAALAAIEREAAREVQP